MTKKLLLLVFVALVSLGTGAAAAPQDTPVKLPPFTKFQLSNGMTVLLMEQHEVPIVSFNFIVKAGSAADPTSREGVAALTADLLRKGTMTSTAEKIAADLDYIGGQFDVTASPDFTSGSAEFLKKDLQKGLGILAEVFMGATFPESELTKLKQRQIDAIKSAKDRAASVIGLYFNAYLFGSHLYSRPVGGDERSLKSITRNDILKFYGTHYTPSNFILAAAGDFNAADLREAIESQFQRWAPKAAAPVTVPQPQPSTGRRLLLVDKPDSTQTYFYIGNLGISRTNPDRVPISVVNTLFGGRFTSRLNTVLRIDSGLTYGASSQFTQRKQAGPFVISSYTRNETTEKAMDKALEVIAALHVEGITQEELQSAKSYLKGQFPPTIETTDSLASTIARLEYYGLDETDINSYTARIDAVTLEEARRIIEKYFPSKDLVFVLVGKASEIEGIAKKYAPRVERKVITEPGY